MKKAYIISVAIYLLRMDTVLNVIMTFRLSANILFCINGKIIVKHPKAEVLCYMDYQCLNDSQTYSDRIIVYNFPMPYLVFQHYFSIYVN